MKKWAVIVVVLLMCTGVFGGVISTVLGMKEGADAAEDTVETVPVYTTREKVYADNNPDLSYDEVKEQVWLGLDQDAYEHASVVGDPASYTVLVNKHWMLPEDWEPDDLEQLPERVEGTAFYLRSQAAQAFADLTSACDQAGFLMGAVGGYMNAGEVQELYEQAVKQQSQAYADLLFAPAGYSEYQTGLAVDVWIDGQGENIADIAKSEQYEWLVKTAADYGFIVRYTEDGQALSQMAAQPWHLRYVGPDLARELYASGQSFDEYVAQKMA